MTAVTDILFQLDLDKECSGGVQARTRTTTGLLQALAVCTEFMRDHIGGGGATALAAQGVDCDTADYAVLKALHERRRRGVTA